MLILMHVMNNLTYHFMLAALYGKEDAVLMLTKDFGVSPTRTLGHPLIANKTETLLQCNIRLHTGISNFKAHLYIGQKLLMS